MRGSAITAALLATAASGAGVTPPASGRPPAAAPRVIATVPSNGATGVAAGIIDLQVTFDQPMRPGSYSITTLPGMAPVRVVGTPVLSRDGRVFRARAGVAAGTRYGFSVNNARFRNFRSLSGTPAVPHPVTFVTGR